VHDIWPVGSDEIIDLVNKSEGLSMLAISQLSSLTKLFELQYGITIIPVVGILSNKDAFSPVLDSAEVEAVFDVPLEMFLKVLILQFSLNFYCFWCKISIVIDIIKCK